MAQLFGKNYQETGSSSSPLLLKSNGEIKVQWGNKYIDLVKNGKINSSAKEYVFTVSSKDDISDDGIYLVTEDNSIWFSQDGNTQQISAADNSYVSFNSEQETTSDQKLQALTNIGFYYDTIDKAQEAGNGIIFNKADNKLYIVNNGVTSEYTPTTQAITVPTDVLSTTNNQSVINLAWAKAMYNKLFPVGTIIMYNNNLTIPDGWCICDGTNNSPNLIGKFIKGGYTMETNYTTSTEESTEESTDSSTTEGTRADDSTEESTEDDDSINYNRQTFSVIFIMKYKDLD